jgi:hypothetical protein
MGQRGEGRRRQDRLRSSLADPSSSSDAERSIVSVPCISTHGSNGSFKSCAQSSKSGGSPRTTAPHPTFGIFHRALHHWNCSSKLNHGRGRWARYFGPGLLVFQNACSPVRQPCRPSVTCCGFFLRREARRSDSYPPSYFPPGSGVKIAPAKLARAV